MTRIDPWKSLEIKDYDKVIKDLGVDRIGNLYKKLPLDNIYFKRGFIFGHKDFNKVVEAIVKKEPFVMMTGLMPSGNFHLGHRIIADLIIYFQRLGAECYIAVADIESYLTRDTSLEEAKKTAIEEYLLNYIALGLKAKKTKFYFQSSGTKEYMNLSKYIAKKTTFNELKDVYGELTPEKIISAFTQVADILHPQLKENGGPKPTVVPVGLDQLPHISLTRDIANRMKSEYNFILPSSTFSKMLPGLDSGKMSSSDPNSAIFLTDSEKQVETKIKKYAFSGGQATIKEHRKKGGNPDVDISYQYLTFLEENDKKLERVYNEYKSGKLLTSELKEILIEKLNSFLKKHREKRKRARKEVDKFIQD